MASAPEMTAALTEPFPVEVIEEKNGLSYIPHEIIRERLISATDNTFDWSIDQVLFRDDGVTRRANDRYTGEAVRPLSMLVIGTLTIPGLGSRAGIGAHPLDAGAGEDAAYKSAESDALKRAAMAFGVGLHQLYIETGEAKRNPPTRSGTRGTPRNAPQNRSGDVPAASSTANGNPPAKRESTRIIEKLTARPVAPEEPAAYATEVSAAIAAHDGIKVSDLIDQAEGHEDRWIALINAAESPQALDWIKRQMERKQNETDRTKAVFAERFAYLNPVTSTDTATIRKAALAAVQADDAKAFGALAKECDRNPRLWAVLVEVASKKETLDWIVKKTSAMDILDAPLDDAIKAKREKLTGATAGV